MDELSFISINLYPSNLKTLAFWQSIFCKKTLSRASDSQSYRERGTVFSCKKDEAKTSVFRLFGYRSQLPDLGLMTRKII
jgi:hypothetical protein